MTGPPDEDVGRAADAALRGELVVLPTDTVYGIGTRPDDPAATARLFQAKARPRDLELPVLVPSVEWAERVGRFDATARLLAGRHWPGALTIVVPRTDAGAGWDLGGDPRTVGLRVPDHPVALALLERTGPLAVTSANLSGHPTPATGREVAALFGPLVSVVLDAGAPLTNRPSTVVAVVEGNVRVLRRGAVTPMLDSA
ncbi:MAG TPA: L-threonylcarbamoyladenylate synthase [Actinomycetota bacterium]